MSIFLAGCGGKPLSEREIIRALFWEKQGATYSVCLLSVDPDAPKEEEHRYKTTSATGTTPAEALANAEQVVQNTPYYGLMDLTALPSSSDWTCVQQIGKLLYEKAQPSPELSVFLLPQTDSGTDWASDAGGLYDAMKAREKTSKVHCGLQMLFAQEDGCSVPVYAPQGLQFAVLLKGQPACLLEEPLTASLAAILAGQGSALQGRFDSGQADCHADAAVLAEGETVQLHLKSTRLNDLGPGRRSDKALQPLLAAELQTAFRSLLAENEAGGDVFHFAFGQACRRGESSAFQAPVLKISFDG